MKRILAILAALALAAPATAATPRRPLTDFDVRKVQGVADQLALCDLTAFLNTGPNVQADVIVGPHRGGGQAPVMRNPYYRPLTGLFDEDLDDALRIMESKHQLTRHDVAVARTRYDGEMLHSYEFAPLTERAFLSDQVKLCWKMFSPRR